jgi:hypothetical protein
MHQMMYLYPTLFAAVLTITRSTTSAFAVDRRHYDRSVRVDVPRTATLLRFSVDDVESQAQAASEAWDVHVTSFLGTAEAAMVQERLQGRGDVACFRVGGAAAPSRSRFVFTNPELGMESAAAEEEYCVVLCQVRPGSMAQHVDQDWSGS